MIYDLIIFPRFGRSPGGWVLSLYAIRIILIAPKNNKASKADNNIEVPRFISRTLEDVELIGIEAR